MNEISLSDDLIVITSEINVWKQQAGQAVFEIGKRLKHVKENDLVHGQWIPWIESIGIGHTTAKRMMQSFEQFGNGATSHYLETSKIFEMLSLPEAVDRQEFIESSHNIPSIGETKTVDEMTVKQLREVTKKLKEAETERVRYENESHHYQKLLNQEKSKPVSVQKVPVEVIPKDYDDLKRQAANGQKLNSENVILSRKNQELNQQIAENRTDELALRKIRNQYIDIMRDITGNHTRMMLEFGNVQGHPDGIKLAMEYKNQLNKFFDSAYRDLDELAEVKQIKPKNGGIDIEYTVVGN